MFSNRGYVCIFLKHPHWIKVTHGLALGNENQEIKSKCEELKENKTQYEQSLNKVLSAFQFRTKFSRLLFWIWLIKPSVNVVLLLSKERDNRSVSSSRSAAWPPSLFVFPCLLSLQRTATWGCSSEVVPSPCTSPMSRGRATASTTRWRYPTASSNCSGCILQGRGKVWKLRNGCSDGSRVSWWMKYYFLRRVEGGAWSQKHYLGSGRRRFQCLLLL